MAEGENISYSRGDRDGIIYLQGQKEMYNRIERRVDKMFENGWVEEVRGLKEKGLTEICN